MKGGIYFHPSHTGFKMRKIIEDDDREKYPLKRLNIMGEGGKGGGGDIEGSRGV